MMFIMMDLGVKEPIKALSTTHLDKRTDVFEIDFVRGKNAMRFTLSVY